MSKPDSQSENGLIDAATLGELERLARSRPRSGRQAAEKASALRTLERIARDGRRRRLPPCPPDWHPMPGTAREELDRAPACVGAPIASATIAAVIAGAHTIVFAEDAERAREFLHDVLGFEGVDAGDGWLIFALPPGEVAVHPGSGWGRGPGHHALFLMCHDIERTVAELERKGVEFVSPIEDEGWGRIAHFKIPGAGEIGLYEPRHPSPLQEFA
jgi:catechol 2,3-dioxygenase-like lactoylglutathione lyase family enzyme